MVRSSDAVLEQYVYPPAQAGIIETQFPEEVRGSLTWQDLANAIEELDESSRDLPVTFIDKTNGAVYVAIDNCQIMHIASTALHNDVFDNLEHLASEDYPVVVV